MSAAAAERYAAIVSAMTEMAETIDSLRKRLDAADTRAKKSAKSKRSWTAETVNDGITIPSDWRAGYAGRIVPLRAWEGDILSPTAVHETATCDALLAIPRDGMPRAAAMRAIGALAILHCPSEDGTYSADTSNVSYIDSETALAAVWIF
jgi:hypothetical protein